jgi:hypothetical protein
MKVDATSSTAQNQTFTVSLRKVMTISQATGGAAVTCGAQLASPSWHTRFPTK